MKYIFFFVFCSVVLASSAKAQYSSQKDAAYLATIKAVANFKINDQEELQKVEELRQSPSFNKKLQKMLDKLTNDTNKNSVNQRVYKILLQAGKDIYNELN